MPAPNRAATARCWAPARQLAMTVVYESPLLCLCDSPKSYLGQPGLEFLRGLPTVWDETVVPSANVGECVIVARRSGDRWYLAAMNSEQPLRAGLSLKFLADGRWRLRAFADTPQSTATPESISDTTRDVQASESLEINLAPGGGFAGILTPLP